MTRTRVSILSVCLLLSIILMGCGQKPEPEAKSPALAVSEISPDSPLSLFEGLTGNLDIAGGTAHIPVMKKAAQAIMTQWPDIHITVAGGGSGVGARKVGEGLVQIGNTGRPLSEDEISQFGLVSHAFAVDGVCAVVHPDNPVHELTVDQLKQVFAGELSNWQELGGKDESIHLYTRDEASGTRKVFWKKALNKGTIAATANVVSSNGSMKTAVSQDSAALGYVSVGHLDDSVKAPSLDGVAVTQKNSANGTYPVTRKLYMNTKGQPEKLTAAFIKFVQGPAGDSIISAAGYIPLTGK